MNIYASKGAAALAGNHENTEVGEFMRDYLELDLKHITRRLREHNPRFDIETESGDKQSWMGPLPEPGKNLDHFDAYHGDF